MEKNPEFALGTFSFKGDGAFSGLLARGKALPLSTLEQRWKQLPGRLNQTETLLGFLEAWESNEPVLGAIIDAFSDDPALLEATFQDAYSLTDLQVRPPVQARQIICTGANYFTHCVQMTVDMGAGWVPGTEDMSEGELRAFARKLMTERIETGYPYAFAKLPSCITGPYDPVTLPADVSQPDWELELAVVMGRKAHRVSREDAMEYVAGYTIANDISNRERIYRKDTQALGSDWLAGKCSPGYLPLGPFIVPARQVANPMDLKIVLSLNDQIMQNETTADMVFNIPRQIEHITQHVMLYPGDIICTGSPAGNGTHYGRFLQDGDVMRGSITGLGYQRNACVLEQL